MPTSLSPAFATFAVGAPMAVAGVLFSGAGAARTAVGAVLGAAVGAASPTAFEAAFDT